MSTTEQEPHLAGHKTNAVTFSGPFHPLDDVRVSSYPSRGARAWRLTLLPPEDKVLLLTMHSDPRCDVPITVYLFAILTLQRIFRGILVRRRLVFVLTHPDARALLHHSHSSNSNNHLDRIDWNALRFRYWRMAESVVAERYAEWYPSVAASMTNIKETANRFQQLRAVVCARWQAALLNREFTRWAEYDRWQIYFVAATSLQRAYRAHRQWLVRRGSRAAITATKRHYLIKARASKKGGAGGIGSSPGSTSDEQQEQLSSSIMASPDKTMTRGEYRAEHFRPYSTMSRENFAAAVIQELWRRFVYRRVFLLFVRLIRSREGAATQHVLRAVSPSEAYLADKATQLHARFRLAAPVNPKDKFPPSIVFKIFTHSNVADICSFAPRNYVADRQVQWGPNMFVRGNLSSNGSSGGGMLTSPTLTTTRQQKSQQQQQQQLIVTQSDVRKHNTVTRAGWYERNDNNEWRLVADVALLARRECGPEVIEATTIAAARHYFAQWLEVPQKQRLPQQRIVDDYIAMTATTARRAAKALRQCTKSRRVQQRERELKQKQRDWMVSLYSGSETAVAQAASSVQQIVKQVQTLLGGAKSTSALRDEDIARLTRHEARRAVDSAFDCLTEEEQQEESERLLQWTEHLDARKYAEDWMRLGTTGM